MRPTKSGQTISVISGCARAGGDLGIAFTACNWLGGLEPAETRPCDQGFEDCHRVPAAAKGRHSSYGSQYCSHDYQKLLRQNGFKVSMSAKGNCYDNCRRRGLLQNHQGRADIAAVIGNAQAGRDGNLRIHKQLLQSTTSTLNIGLQKPSRLRTESGLNELLGRHKSATGPTRFAQSKHRTKIAAPQTKPTDGLAI